jgi:hypothetical protein
LSVDGEGSVHDRSLGELLVARRVAPLATVLGLPLAEAQLQPWVTFERDPEIQQTRAHEVVLEVVVDPGADRVAPELEARPLDEKAEAFVLLEVQRQHGVLVGADHAPELKTEAHLGAVVAVAALDHQPARPVGDGRAGRVLRGRGRPRHCPRHAQ